MDNAADNILLVPTEAGASLLEPGNCKGRVPTVYQAHSPGGKSFWTTSQATQGVSKTLRPASPHEMALPLRWRGQDCPMSIGRAMRCDPHDDSSSGPWASLMSLARELERLGLCKVVTF